MRPWDLNPQPLEHESAPVTTRPGLPPVSVTRLGDFWKFLATKFVKIVAKIICNFLGLFWKPNYYVKTGVATYGATFGNIWATFHSNIWSHCRPYTHSLLPKSFNLTRVGLIVLLPDSLFSSRSFFPSTKIWTTSVDNIVKLFFL